MNEAAQGERLQKVLARLGLASRREAEEWIRAGRLSINGRPAQLGMRVGPADRLQLDGRPIRQPPQARAARPVFLCHRSPGEPLLADSRTAADAAVTSPAGRTSMSTSVASRLPRRAGVRFVSVSPLPTVDGGLELLTADGALAARLQRAVHALESEFSLRVRGEINAQQEQGVRGGQLDRGATLRVVTLEAAGGEASNRWYRLVTVGASGNDIRQLFERQGVTVVRLLRTRLGPLSLPRELPRSRSRELQPPELQSLLQAQSVAADLSPVPAPDSPGSRR